MLGPYQVTEHLTAGILELNPGEISATHSHGGDEVVYAVEGVLHVRAFGEDGISVFELNPDDAAYIPKGTNVLVVVYMAWALLHPDELNRELADDAPEPKAPPEKAD